MQLGEVLSRRLAAQHLTGDPLPSVAAAVRHSLAVQSQDMPLARFSLGLRTGLTDAEVLTQLAAGDVVRTHVLRPTWHWVCSDDLRWLIALTGQRSLSGSAARHRQLGIDDDVIDRAVAVFRRELAGAHLTRKELHPFVPATGYPRQGEVVAHLLFVGESLGILCSGTPGADGEHTYALVDEVVPPAAPLDRDEAIARLVSRFVAGHGPTAAKDLMRWARLPRTQATRALDDAGLLRTTVEGTPLWFAADGGPAGSAPKAPTGAWLLPTFDEAFLSHDHPRFPRVEGHPWATGHLNAAEAGGGVLVVDGRDVGVFKRRVQRGRLTVDVFVAAGATASDRAAAHGAAGRLGVHLGMEPEVTVHSARP